MPQPLLPEYLDSKQEVPEVKIAGLAELETRIDSLERDMARLRLQMSALSQEGLRTIARLLSPLYKSLKPIFGEMEAGGIEEPRSSPGKSAKWEAVKQRLAPRLREAIDILQMQGSMKRTQLASALKMDYSNCTKNVVGVLLRQGWIVDNGGNLSLKEL